jgi:hypothetical protein
MPPRFASTGVSKAIGPRWCGEPLSVAEVTDETDCVLKIIGDREEERQKQYKEGNVFEGTYLELRGWQLGKRQL